MTSGDTNNTIDETGGASHKAIFYRVLLTWQHLIRTKQTEKANLTRE